MFDTDQHTSFLTAFLLWVIRRLRAYSAPASMAAYVS